MKATIKKAIISSLKKALGNKYDYYKIKTRSNVFSVKSKLREFVESKPAIPVSKPLVSIVMTVYNREKYIRLAIDSVLNQSYGNFELIIVNDGSKDKSEEIIKEYNDPRIKYFYKENSGQLDTFKFGYSKISGEYVTRLDSDDMFHKDAVLSFVNYAVEKEADFVYSNLLNIDEENNFLSESKYDSYNNPKNVLRDIFKNFYSVIPDVAFWKREYLDYVLTNYINENIPFYIDNILAVKYAHIDKPLYQYRHHNSNYVSNTQNLLFVTGGIIKTIDIIARMYNINDFIESDKDITKEEGCAIIAKRYLDEAKKYQEGIFGNYKYTKEDKVYEPFLREATYWLEESLKAGKIEIQEEIKVELNNYDFDYNVSEVSYEHKNKRVLVVSADNPYGGKSVGGKHIHIYLLQEGLKENKITNDIVAYDEKEDLFVDIKRLAQKFELDANALKSSKDIAFLYRVYNIQEQLEEKLNQYFKRHFVSYINCHDVIGTIAAYNTIKKIGKNIPIITTLHGYFTYENVDYGGLIKESYIYNNFLKYEKKAYEVSQQIITVDTRIKDYVLRSASVKDENVTIIKNAINDKDFIPTTEEQRLNIIKELELNENMIFVPRRLVPKNGVKYVVEAIKYLVDKGNSNLQLVVAGDGPERPAIEEFIRNNKIGSQVKLLGDITHDKILSYFKAAKVVVVPSVPSNDVQEATSLSALEGMACGKVVIATAIGGLKEIIRDDENGYLVEPKDSELLGKAIETALSLKKEKYALIAETARENIVNHHGYVGHSKTFLEVYDRCL